MKEERNIKVKLHDGSIIQMHTEERIIGHQLHEDALEIVVDPDAVFDDVLITLEKANKQIRRLETALFTHQNYDKTVSELHEENERLRKALEEVRAEYSKEGTDIQVLRRMIKIIDAALGEGDKE
ncbi:hypothetical protein J1TS5_25970 [Paenibacillus macerans]|uniref:hypothetical protein n=1 Tax=Paenibacillus macerans TaxID=44252 RepID=UPI001B2C8F8A|nr:hypothetical protein [Paenibacillus macerans]GIP10427.1 hypothetical protein J1TS5_25970 [Paenibacillus macerans]